MANLLQKRVKLQKQSVLDFVTGDDIFNWKVVISRKALTEGVNHYAEVDFNRRCITINPHRSVVDSVRSIVHEILHILHPNSREKTVLRWENEIFTDLSPLETTMIIQQVYGRAIWDE